MSDALRWLGPMDVERLLPLDECIDAVALAFRDLGQGRVAPSRVLGFPVTGGGFHVKTGVIDRARSYFVAKVNANFPGNPVLAGLPTVQGLLFLADADVGTPLAVMDSGAITALRTAAATGVAARYLARPQSHVAAIVGCGVQGRVQLAALRAVLPLERAWLIDQARDRAQQMAREHAGSGLEVLVADDLASAIQLADVVVTCTPAHEPFLERGSVRPGTFVAAVGADHPEKSEIHPALTAACTVVVDDLDQCASMGDLHHALAARTMTLADVHASLAELVTGARPGRTDDAQITLFDSTGLGLQDAASAALVYERAMAQGLGQERREGDRR